MSAIYLMKIFVGVTSPNFEGVEARATFRIISGESCDVYKGNSGRVNISCEFSRITIRSFGSNTLGHFMNE